VTIWFLGVAVAILFLGGISLDLWRAVDQRRELAGLADAAALAGAGAVDTVLFVASQRDGGVPILDLDPTHAHAAAVAYLDAFAPAGVTGHVSIVRPPGSATYVVEVSLERSMPLTLLRVLLPDEAPVVLRAEARAVPLHRPP